VGAVSNVAGGIMERSLQGIARNENLPGQHEVPTFAPESFIPDIVGGAVGAYAAYETGHVIAQTIEVIDEWTYLLATEMAGATAEKITEELTNYALDFAYGYEYDYYEDKCEYYKCEYYRDYYDYYECD